ncbi:MAG: tetratricopeptide repeat protein, partial [Rhodothermales bacterium]
MPPFLRAPSERAASIRKFLLLVLDSRSRHTRYGSASWRIALLLAVALVVGGGTARAQDMDSTQVARYQLADAYLRAGQFDRAISLFEDLYAGSKANYAFYSKLKEAYESIKRYDDAVELVNEKLAASSTPQLVSDLARLHYLQNEEENAYATLEE